jgi:competence protein ComEC
MQFFLSFLIGVVLFYSFQYFPYATVVLSCISALTLFVRKNYLLVAVLLTGAMFAFLRYEPPLPLPQINNDMEIQGVFRENPVRTGSGMFRQAFSVQSAFDRSNGESIGAMPGQDMVVISGREFPVGTEYGLAVKPFKSSLRLNPGERVNDTLYASLLNVYESGNARESVHARFQGYRHRINKYIEAHCKKDSGALVASITTGQMTNMSEELREAFNATGLAHILSISGTHFGLFSVFLFAIFGFFIKRLPHRILQRLSLYLSPSQAAAILCLPFMLAYLGLSGGSIPAIRSFIMITLFLFGLVIGRKGFWLVSLLCAAFLLVVWDPGTVFSLSFQLSFLAVFFIGFSIQEKDEEMPSEKKAVRHIRSAFFMTIAALFGTAPLVAYAFHYFSIISPLSNLVIAPLIGFLLIPLSVISSFFYLITGSFVLMPAISAIADMSIAAVTLFSRIPFADVKVPAFPPVLILVYYVCFSFYFLFGKKRYLLIIPFLPFVIFLSLSLIEGHPLSATFLDVGQGDAAVVALPDGKTMVIDTGRTGREVSSFLNYRGEETIDFLVLSHSHPDHTGGAEHLTKKYDVKELWSNGRLVLPAAFGRIKQRPLARGDMIEGRGYTIYILHPYPEFYTYRGGEYDTENNDSLVLKIAGEHTSFLFSGDIQEEAEEDILHIGKWLQSDVIKVPHHGGKTSAYEPFFEAASPEIAVISAGRENPFGHPHQQTLDVLRDIRVFTTQESGAVRITEAGRGLKTETFQEFQLKKTNSLGEELRNYKKLFAVW